MPDWNTPETWVLEEIVKAPKLNRHLRDDIQWLKAPPFTSYLTPALVTTTSTSFIQVTSCQVSVTSAGGNILIAACGESDNSAAGNINYWDLAIDGTRVGDASLGLSVITACGIQYADNISMTYFTTSPPSAGAHTYSVHWKVSAGTGRCFLRLFAIELR